MGLLIIFMKKKSYGTRTAIILDSIIFISINVVYSKRVLHRSCICIDKLDVRFLNHLNWTSTIRVMIHFLGLPQLRLFNSLWDRIMAGFVVFFGDVYSLCRDCFGYRFHGLVVISLVDCFKPNLGTDF